MKNNIFKFLGILACLSMFSACGVKNASDENGAAQDGPLTIEGTTTWLINLVVPSAMAEDITCPDGFYPRRIVTSSNKDDSVATSDPNACPNEVTSCDSDHGCAYLYTFSDKQSEALTCVVPIDPQDNSYHFNFTKKPEGITGAVVKIVNSDVVDIVAPNSCQAYKLSQNTVVKSLDTTSGYQCAPNPVEGYREVTVDIDGTLVKADSDKDTTLQSPFKRVIDSLASDTLKEEFKIARDSIIEEIKQKFGDKGLNLSDPTVIADLTDSTVAQEQMLRTVANSAKADIIEKVKSEFESKMKLDKLSKPEELEHFSRQNQLISRLTQNIASNLENADEVSEEDKLTVEKLYKLNDEIQSKNLELKKKVAEIKFEAIKDPNKPFSSKKQDQLTQILDMIGQDPIKAVSERVTVDLNQKMRALEALSADAIRTADDPCAVEDGVVEDHKFDFDVYMEKSKESFTYMIQSLQEEMKSQDAQLNDAEIALNESETTVLKLLSIDSASINKELISEIAIAEKAFFAALKLRKAEYDKLQTMRTRYSEFKASSTDMVLKAYTLQLEQVAEEISNTVDADILLGLQQKSDDISKSISELTNSIAINTVYQLSNIWEEKWAIHELTIKTNYITRDYLDSKIKTYMEWNQLDSTLGLTSLINSMKTQSESLTKQIESLEAISEKLQEERTAIDEQIAQLQQ